MYVSLNYSTGSISYWVNFFYDYFRCNTKPILEYLKFYYKDLLESKDIKNIENKLLLLSTRFISAFFKESFLKKIIILLLIDGNFLFDLYINYIIYCLEKAKNIFDEDTLYKVEELFKKD